MANVVNFPITLPGLVTKFAGDTNYAGQLVWWRVVQPQPFNATGVVTNRPTSGQMWPRGRE